MLHTEKHIMVMLDDNDTMNIDEDDFWIDDDDIHAGSATYVDDTLLDDADDDADVHGEPIIKPHTLPTDRPVLFLDFDGVMNRLARDEVINEMDIDKSTLFDADIAENVAAVSTYGTESTYLVQVSSELCGKIKSLIEEGVCSLCWLTSWKSQAVYQLGKHLGFDDLEGDKTPTYVDWMYRGLSDSGMYGKVEGIVEAFENDELHVPFVSVDDDEIANIIKNHDDAIDEYIEACDDGTYDEIMDADCDDEDADLLAITKKSRLDYGKAQMDGVFGVLPHKALQPWYITGIDRPMWDDIERTLREMKKGMDDGVWELDADATHDAEHSSESSD